MGHQTKNTSLHPLSFLLCFTSLGPSVLPPGLTSQINPQWVRLAFSSALRGPEAVAGYLRLREASGFGAKSDGKPRKSWKQVLDQGLRSQGLFWICVENGQGSRAVPQG